jgi:hypothetical protein
MAESVPEVRGEGGQENPLQSGGNTHKERSLAQVGGEAHP